MHNSTAPMLLHIPTQYFHAKHSVRELRLVRSVQVFFEMSNITILRYAYKTITGSLNFNIIGHLGVGTLLFNEPNPNSSSHFPIPITTRD